jgi:hypothetical protein
MPETNATKAVCMSTRISTPGEIEELRAELLPCVRVTLGKKSFTRVIEPKFTYGSPLFEIFRLLHDRGNLVDTFAEDYKSDLRVLANKNNPPKVILEGLADSIVDELDKVPE